MSYSLRQKLGALLIDVPHYCARLLQNKWLKIKNRDDEFSYAADKSGVKCEWRWTNELYLPKIFPWFGKQLFKAVSNECRFELITEPGKPSQREPQVCFIIGHRGKARTPLLMKTLESIAAQSGCNIECIVVEQDSDPHLETLLPPWVKHIVTPLPSKDLPYSRAWAFNVGAQHARADCLILHDNDLLISSNYASETLRRYKQGFEFINLKRFIFYLTENATHTVLAGHELSAELALDSIMQNAEGGGSIGVSRQAYFEIGGFDEHFVGWGGEDNEFWERAQTRKIWPYAYLPLIHLWHGVQQEKLDFETSKTKALYNSLSKKPPSERIIELNTRTERTPNSTTPTPSDIE